MKRISMTAGQKTALVLVFAALLLMLACAGRLWAGEPGADSPDAGAFYIEETGKTYQYELELCGRFPNSAVDAPVSFYVYTNDPDMTFDDLCRALFSSQATDYDFALSTAPLGGPED